MNVKRPSAAMPARRNVCRSQASETRSITSHVTCNTINVIYMVQCNRCNLQYIGESKRRLKDRFNEHRRAVDKTNIKCKPTTVSEHFLSHPNHSHTDMQLIPLEKIHSSRYSVRKARESHLIDKAMTLEPNGLNRHDELLQSISLLFFLFQFLCVYVCVCVCVLYLIFASLFHLPFLSSNAKILKAFLKTFPTKTKPPKCPAGRKKKGGKKRERGGGGGGGEN